MSAYKDEFKFKLSTPIKYQSNNTFKTCEELILRAPSIKNHYRIGNILQSLFFSSMVKAEKSMTDTVKDKKRIEESTTEELKFDSKMIKMILLMGCDDINNFYDKFENLLLSKNICFFEDNISMTQIELNVMDQKDFKNLVAEYVANFFIASWMSDLD